MGFDVMTTQGAGAKLLPNPGLEVPPTQGLPGRLR